MLTFDEALAILKTEIKEKRVIHTLGVVGVAKELARIYNINIEETAMAALLHDCAKYYTTEDKINLCKEDNIDINEVELNNPELLHAKAGAVLAKKKYKVNSQDIYQAIFYHTTGKADMTMMEKIIFVADYIEPGRNHSDKLPLYRELVKTDIDKTVGLILDETVKYLDMRENNKIKAVDPTTKAAYEYYKQFIGE